MNTRNLGIGCFFKIEAQGYSLFLKYSPAIRFTACPLLSGLKTTGLCRVNQHSCTNLVG